MRRRTSKSNSRRQTGRGSGQPTAVGEVRLIGGDWRGRKLPVLSAEGLRPTSDRVRETLFNWLQFEIPGANCLDLFAGSGALGFEALSRGAKNCLFLELSADNAEQLRSNLQVLKSDKGQVHQCDSLQWLDQQATQQFDVVFVDPPFNRGLMQPAVDSLFKNGWIDCEHAWLYLEQEKSLDWPQLPEEWRCYREKTTSQVRFGLFCKQE
ncbi:16S rRNA (guanine(966)-N(2))-methyltransferase RsmD [Thiomicrorhabdus sp. 6S3-12]|uniref:16S rRNA (guanine(966)-N(2))-methyltransferase RsmD n=1 Tax=Thiomicrorhabdus sp. 6S3-12 TaxID=2819681 RepID=UPI001AAC4C72|nr:16S rRNA (guanine(966)-N(2))-methyltransferase RsmD [Thiomicrorhabdus sp. 6S3-12]MBO1925048.1 16S rRNA (guanine(966)-N(2))-methyltransferase RsmD [Thiomicrorhabdus sp. 6S3-12]